VIASNDADRPVHMRGAPSGKPRRIAVRVRLTIDGISQERSYEAKGISHDGPAIDVWRHELAAGSHTVMIELLTGETDELLRWSGVIESRARHVQVITYDPSTGFRIE
jgi:hypothetical protein